jgi:hypothetical protein
MFNHSLYRIPVYDYAGAMSCYVFAALLYVSSDINNRAGVKTESYTGPIICLLVFGTMALILGNYIKYKRPLLVVKKTLLFIFPMIGISYAAVLIVSKFIT